MRDPAVTDPQDDLYLTLHFSIPLKGSRKDRALGLRLLDAADALTEAHPDVVIEHIDVPTANCDVHRWDQQRWGDVESYEMSLQFADEAHGLAFIDAMDPDLRSECVLVLDDQNGIPSALEAEVTARYGLGIFEECAL